MNAPPTAAGAEIIRIASEQAFNESVLGAESCVVFFDAAWCGACRPIAARLSTLLAGRAEPRLARVDVDALPALSRRYGVAGVPTLILFVRGQPASIKIGEIDEEGLQNWLDAS